MEIKEFDPTRFEDRDWEEYLKFLHSFIKEIYPVDPLPSNEILKSEVLEPSKEFDIWRWLAYSQDGEIIGSALLSYPNEKSPMYNTHKNIGNIEIIVEKKHRRQGIGTQLLRLLFQKSKEINREVLQTVTNLKEGREFCLRYGAKIASYRSINRLYMKDINWKEMNKWCLEGKRTAKGVTIETFQDVPEEYIEEFVELYTKTENLAPDYETGDYKGLKVTTESRRYSEEFHKKKDFIWTTKVTKEEDGTLSGFTEIYFNKHLPYAVDQDMTGVLPQYRGKKLGKWLKADMLFYIRENYPNIIFIETGNANNNTPMLSINKRMGFKKHIEEYLMKLDVNNISID